MLLLLPDTRWSENLLSGGTGIELEGITGSPDKPRQRIVLAPCHETQTISLLVLACGSRRPKLSPKF